MGRTKHLFPEGRPVTRWLLTGLLAMVTWSAALAQLGDPCIVADNGTGTVDLPPKGCIFRTPQEVFKIIDGLPPGTTIEMTPHLGGFFCRNPLTNTACLVEDGGLLGGQREVFNAVMVWELRGTGELSGYRRIISLEFDMETQSAPRAPGEALQGFDREITNLQGSLPPDPDFSSLTIISGRDNGLTSFGHTFLHDLGDGTFLVDSFYDVPYQIDFVGAPGGVLEGLAGSTQGTTRLEARGNLPDRRCETEDNGTGTATLPPEDCSYLSPQQKLFIINGTPPGSIIEMKPTLYQFDCPQPCGQPGGILGGEVEVFNAMLRLNLEGTGELSDFRRTLRVPVSVETHSAPRVPGQPVQYLTAELVSLQGSIAGDPDFASLSITAGSNFGLPSPGHTTLQEVDGGKFQVDSFFDITYQIEFTGAAGGALAGRQGTTQGTINIESRRSKTDVTGQDNGTGTVTLPPEKGQYVNPINEMVIQDGLPPGSVLELMFSLESFFCQVVGCGQTGGDLGGEREVFEASLGLEIRGTGNLAGFLRNLSMPVTLETHSAMRAPGDAVQRFDTQIFSMDGAITGDPDFANLTITAGSDHDLPTPGHTTLTDLGDGNFLVDSFFDITYRIEFTGAPGGALDGMSSTDERSVRAEVCERSGALAHNITIVKSTNVPDPTDFDFTGSLGNFSLDDDSNVTLSDRRIFNNLEPGTYEVSELIEPGWLLTDIVCTDLDNGTVVDVGAGLATIDLDLGEAVVCEFIATRCAASPTATVTGNAIICSGESAQIEAALTGTGPWDLTWSDGVMQQGVTVSPATRTVSPTATTTYSIVTLSDSVCGGLGSGSATITTFTNPTARFTMPSKGMGLDPVSFSVDAICVTPPIQYDFSTDPPTPFTEDNETITIGNSPPPSQTTLIEVTVSGGTPRGGATTSALLLVAANDLFFDFNGDGCNNLKDLWRLAQDWLTPFAQDADGNATIDVRDFLYLNLDDPIDCTKD
ncbi:hypothetical protein SCOR_00325 [Sulfidibacter corallicola]|uniref:SpaA-like prealbumin fold domain-containing protein n=1 Tax=Sulfidibacter corallicola TaxID=2818388 RepID=A0A8A4TG30_SULCO|nr:hypothetical protein [Sulfidibacter corallicola]QTD49029.1 hypothetical protein J3U87_25875 [Sulfidibacter corallicola]